MGQKYVGSTNKHLFAAMAVLSVPTVLSFAKGGRSMKADYAVKRKNVNVVLEWYRKRGKILKNTHKEIQTLVRAYVQRKSG